MVKITPEQDAPTPRVQALADRDPPLSPQSCDFSTRPTHPSPLTTHAPPLSEARRRANRLNAKKSTGPRTPEGKARSSRNALKGGLIARCGALFDDGQPEDRALLALCLDELRKTYRPIRPEQELLIQRAALCKVKRARAARLEDLWAEERRQELRQAAQREADRRLADLDRRIADAERASNPTALPLLHAHRNMVEISFRSCLENAQLLGALPAPDRTEALIRFEASADRALRRIARQLDRSLGVGVAKVFGRYQESRSETAPTILRYCRSGL